MDENITALFTLKINNLQEVTTMPNNQKIGMMEISRKEGHSGKTTDQFPRDISFLSNECRRIQLAPRCLYKAESFLPLDSTSLRKPAIVFKNINKYQYL